MATTSSDAVLYDTVNSYYAGIARMALEERGVRYTSQYVSMPNMEQLAPWYMRINPAGQIPALRTAAGEIVGDSRGIVDWAYGSEETPHEKELLDLLYAECPGSLAWLTGEATIPLLKVMVRSPAVSLMLPRKIRRLQAENPDLHDTYERKLAAALAKHFTKALPDVQARIQAAVDGLDAQLSRSGGPWLLGAAFCRVDAVAVAHLQWVERCNEYGAAPIALPEGMRAYLAHARERQSFRAAIGQHGDAAFVLTMIRDKNAAAGWLLGGLGLAAAVCGVAVVARRAGAS